MPTNATAMTITTPQAPSPSSADSLRQRAARLGLHGIVARWDEHREASWLPTVIEIEETERQRRSLERRIRNARIGRFKPLVDYEWDFPRRIDRQLIEDIFNVRFPDGATNVVIVGPNGTGKTMIAQNLAQQAVLRGHTVRFVTASEMLNHLATQESPGALQRALRRYCHPGILSIDEVGYLSYDSRYADLLFEVISRRHQQKPTIITTNRHFRDWGEVFPNATSVVALVDRLVHRAEIIEIDGPSYRLEEAKEREAARARLRASQPGKGKVKAHAAAKAR